MRAVVALAVASLLLAACSAGGMGHVHYLPSPTPHNVVVIR